MIVLAWFTLVAIIILIGFAVLGVTFHHWYKQGKMEKEKAKQLTPHSNLSR